jgi:hypothetical protein
MGGFGGQDWSVSAANGGTPGGGAANYWVSGSNQLNGKGGNGMVIVYW